MKILGTEYKINFVKKPNELMETNDWLGYCDTDKKEIYVLINKNKKKNFIHECTHAILYEMGDEEKSCDEEYVEKLTRIFEVLLEIIK